MIPAERQQELIVVIENPHVSALISPPVIDGAIVSGHPVRPDGRTVYFTGADPVNGVLRLETANGLVFAVGSTQQIDPTGFTSNTRITIGEGPPTVDPVSGVDALHFDTLNNKVYEWVEAV